MTAASATAPAPERIHVIFKTHLDVGFTQLAEVVLRQYRQRYIPRAIEVAQQMRRAGGQDRFIWTTGSYLIWDFLEHGSAQQRRAMEGAITAGDIVWHALPFTTHTELMDADLLTEGLQLSRDLDRRFGKSTIAAKMTDVTGHTRAMVPVLAEAGVRLLHIGVNPASSFPKVPPLFRWQDPGTGTEVMVMYHTTYGDLTAGRAPGGSDGLVFAHTGDNQGPQDAAKLSEEFSQIRRHYPTSLVMGSTLDAFAASLLPVQASLPVLTCEIGDNWIHGAGTDPAKVAGFRALLRLRTLWRQQELTESEQAHISRFSRRLLLIPEHTWGMDIKTHLSDEVTWTIGDLARMRRTAKYRRVEASWKEQRSYLEQAVNLLGRGRLADQARVALSGCRPQAVTRSGWSALPESAPIATAQFTVALDSRTGGICRLDQGGRSWADASHQIGGFLYQTFSAADYRRFYSQYSRDTHLHEWWILRDITRHGMPETVADGGWWRPLVVRTEHRRHDQADELLAHLQMPRQARQQYGCPGRILLHYRFPDREPGLELTLLWFDKRATRLPEASWLPMRPLVADPAAWRLTKLGQAVSPMDVPEGGSRHLHAVMGATYQAADGAVHIESLDTPLVAPGKPRLLDFSNAAPDPVHGLNWNLHNNVWCTNFPMWYEDDGQSRFRLHFNA